MIRRSAGVSSFAGVLGFGGFQGAFLGLAYGYWPLTPGTGLLFSWGGFAVDRKMAMMARKMVAVMAKETMFLSIAEAGSRCAGNYDRHATS